MFKQHIEGVWSAKDWLHATRENYKEAKKKKEEQEESERFGRHLSLFPSQLLGLVIS